MISPVPGTAFTSNSQTFTWTRGGANQLYALWVSARAPGGREVFQLGTSSATFVTVNTLPYSGKTYYVRLYTTLNGDWVFNDYTYTAPAPVKATLIAPVPGPISTSPVTFTWNPGLGVVKYSLFVSAVAPGGYEVYKSPYLYATSVTVNVPTGKTPVRPAVLCDQQCLAVHRLRLLTKNATMWSVGRELTENERRTCGSRSAPGFNHRNTCRIRRLRTTRTAQRSGPTTRSSVRPRALRPATRAGLRRGHGPRALPRPARPRSPAKVRLPG